MRMGCHAYGASIWQRLTNWSDDAERAGFLMPTGRVSAQTKCTNTPENRLFCDGGHSRWTRRQAFAARVYGAFLFGQASVSIDITIREGNRLRH
jgi:hypothetical protein